MSTRDEQRESVKKRVIERAKKDDGFRAQLLNDPKKAIESETGIKIPAHVQFNVVQETATNLYIVLSEKTQEELSEKDLESVAGGAADVIVLMY